MHLERRDRSIGARDLRALPLRSVLDGALSLYAKVLRGYEVAPVRPAKPGRRGYEEAHWRGVHARYLHHRRHNPKHVIREMRYEYPPDKRPPEVTMRRWVGVIKDKIERGELPDA